jgi:hypothetical protein
MEIALIAVRACGSTQIQFALIALSGSHPNKTAVDAQSGLRTLIHHEICQD